MWRFIVMSAILLLVSGCQISSEKKPMEQSSRNEYGITQEDIVGTWNVVLRPEDGFDRIDFVSDGTYSAFNRLQKVHSGTWIFVGDVLTLTSDTSQIFMYTHLEQKGDGYLLLDRNDVLIQNGERTWQRN